MAWTDAFSDHRFYIILITIIVVLLIIYYFAYYDCLKCDCYNNFCKAGWSLNSTPLIWVWIIMAVVLAIGTYQAILDTENKNNNDERIIWILFGIGMTSVLFYGILTFVYKSFWGAAIFALLGAIVTGIQAFIVYKYNNNNSWGLLAIYAIWMLYLTIVEYNLYKRNNNTCTVSDSCTEQQKLYYKSLEEKYCIKCQCNPCGCKQKQCGVTTCNKCQRCQQSPCACQQTQTCNKCQRCQQSPCACQPVTTCHRCQRCQRNPCCCQPVTYLSTPVTPAGYYQGAPVSPALTLPNYSPAPQVQVETVQQTKQVPITQYQVVHEYQPRVVPVQTTIPITYYTQQIVGQPPGQLPPQYQGQPVVGKAPVIGKQFEPDMKYSIRDSGIKPVSSSSSSIESSSNFSSSSSSVGSSYNPNPNQYLKSLSN